MLVLGYKISGIGGGAPWVPSPDPVRAIPSPFTVRFVSARHSFESIPDVCLLHFFCTGTVSNSAHDSTQSSARRHTADILPVSQRSALESKASLINTILMVTQRTPTASTLRQNSNDQRFKHEFYS